MTRATQTLSEAEIDWLQKFRREEHISFAEMNNRMQNPFTWQVLQRAMAGQAVWVLNHAHIVAWVEKNAAASGGEKKDTVSEGNRR